MLSIYITFLYFPPIVSLFSFCINLVSTATVVLGAEVPAQVDDSALLEYAALAIP